MKILGSLIGISSFSVLLHLIHLNLEKLIVRISLVSQSENLLKIFYDYYRYA